MTFAVEPAPWAELGGGGGVLTLSLRIVPSGQNHVQALGTSCDILRRLSISLDLVI